MDDECTWLQKYLWMSKWERKRKEANSETDRWEIVCRGRVKEQKRGLMNTETDTSVTCRRVSYNGWDGQADVKLELVG